ncbi:MAG TPA: hypothetical protein VG755_36030 [Nannocystaceae bacterium]|nr:hypothetical protein [Nannocystaceae bacterium]
MVSDLLQPTELAALERMLSSDDEVRARLETLLVEHGVDTLALTIDVSGGRVRLGGATSDRVSALLIEDLAWTLPEVTHCDSAVAVRGEDWSLAS